MNNKLIIAGPGTGKTTALINNIFEASKKKDSKSFIISTFTRKAASELISRIDKDERFDEYSAYRSNMQGILNIKGQVRSIERYMDNWRKRRDRLLRRTDISPTARGELLKQMELERDRRLAIVPELRDRANIPVIRGI